MVRTVSRNGEIAVRAVVATALVAEAAQRHATSPLATVALGRSLMGALLLAAGAKDTESVQLSFEGVGALRRITVVGDSEGRARGFVSHPDVGLDQTELGLEVGRAIGGGTLSVVRSRPTWRDPYTGIVVLESGEIAEDLARYLVESEQVPSAIALGVYLDREGAVRAAAGFLAQALPGATEEEISILEENAGALPNPSALVREGMSGEALCERLLDGIGMRELHRAPVRFHCACDIDRARRSAGLLPDDEIDDLRRRGEAVEVRCAFCGDVFSIPADEIGRREGGTE